MFFSSGEVYGEVNENQIPANEFLRRLQDGGVDHFDVGALKTPGWLNDLRRVIESEMNSGKPLAAVNVTGTVAEESHKSLAEETVANLPGVKSVTVNLSTEKATVEVESQTGTERIIDRVRRAGSVVASMSR